MDTIKNHSCEMKNTEEVIGTLQTSILSSYVTLAVHMDADLETLKKIRRDIDTISASALAMLILSGRKDEASVKDYHQQIKQLDKAVEKMKKFADRIHSKRKEEHEGCCDHDHS